MRAAPTLPVERIRTLTLDVSTGGPGHLSAASGLVRLGRRLVVAADDEDAIGLFDLDGHAPGLLRRLFSGTLPEEPAARKAAKADLEALVHLPPLQGCPQGALLALGSGSRPNRQRAALLALDASGEGLGAAWPLDLAPLYATLGGHVPALNIEGALRLGDELVLLQRGGQPAPQSASLHFHWPALRRWLEGEAPPPAPHRVLAHALGEIDGVPLGFTDGCALPGDPQGRWVFSAAAEATGNAYDDGRCLGSAVGLIGADGRLQRLERLALPCKVEGIDATVEDSGIRLRMVTDADDRARPGLLLQAWLTG